MPTAAVNYNLPPVKDLTVYRIITDVHNIKNTGSCTVHFIREETLRKIVLSQIFDITAMMYDNVDKFFDAVARQKIDEQAKEIQNKKKQMAKFQKRITELDKIFKRIYEDDITGVISHERFLKLSSEYESEQTDLQNQVKLFEE